jgi:hypothetical protein
VSRRQQRRRERQPREAGGAPRDERPEADASGSAEHGRPAAPRGAPGRLPPRIPFLAQAGILVAVFAVVSVIADVVGAANLGVALGIGQIAFAIALVAVIVKT